MVLRLISIVTCIWFVVMGVPKLFGMTAWAIQFEGWGYPPILMYVVGAIETVGGLMLLFRRTALLGAATLLIVMIGAAVTHTFNFDGAYILRPVLSALALLWIVIRRRSAIQRPGKTPPAESGGAG